MSDTPYTTPLTNTPTDYQPSQVVWDFTGKHVNLELSLNCLCLGDSSHFEPMEIHMWLENMTEAQLLEFEEQLRLTLCWILDTFLKTQGLTAGDKPIADAAQDYVYWMTAGDAPSRNGAYTRLLKAVTGNGRPILPVKK